MRGNGVTQLLEGAVRKGWALTGGAVLQPGTAGWLLLVNQVGIVAWAGGDLCTKSRSIYQGRGQPAGGDGRPDFPNGKRAEPWKRRGGAGLVESRDGCSGFVSTALLPTGLGESQRGWRSGWFPKV